METEEIKMIGEIVFHDIKVKVYFHPDIKDNDGNSVWQMRTPDSCYQGIMYMGVDGKFTYPENSIIPEQTEKDREMLPKFIIIGKTELNEEIISSIQIHLDSEYKRRNTNLNIVEILNDLKHE